MWWLWLSVCVVFLGVGFMAGYIVRDSRGG